MPTFPHQANNYSNLHKESDKLSLLSILKKYSGDNIYVGIQEIVRMRTHTAREAGIDLRDRLADRLIKCSETITSHDNIKPVSYLYDLQAQLRQHPDTKEYSEQHISILKKQIEYKSLMVALFETELPEDLSMMIKKSNQKDCNILDDVITDEKQHKGQSYSYLGVHSFLQGQGIAIVNIEKIESAYESTLPGLLVSLDNMNTINHWSSWYRNDLENWFTFIRKKYITKQCDNNIESGLSAFIQSFKRKNLLSALNYIPEWRQSQGPCAGTLNNKSYYAHAKKGKLGVVVISNIDQLVFARSFYFVAQYTQSQMFEKWPLNDRLSFLTLFFQSLDADAFQYCWLGCAERLMALCVRIVRDHHRFLFGYNTIDWRDDSRIRPFISNEKEASPLLHALFMRALFNIQTKRDNKAASRDLLQALKRLADQSSNSSINQSLKRIYAKLFENRSSTKILQKIHPDWLITESDQEMLQAFSQEDQEIIDAIAQRLFTNKADLDAPASYDEKFYPVREIINKKVRQMRLLHLLESEFEASPTWIYDSAFKNLKQKIPHLQTAQELQKFLSDLLSQLRARQSSLPSFNTYVKKLIGMQHTIKTHAALDDNNSLLKKIDLRALEQLCTELSRPMIDRSWRADLEKLFKGQAIDTHCALVPRIESKKNFYLKQIDLEYYDKAFLPQFNTAPPIELFLEHAAALSGLTEKHLCTILSIIGSTAPVAHLEHLGDCYLKSAVSRGYYYLFEQHRAYAQQPHQHSYFLNDTKLSDALISVHHHLIQAYKESDQNDDFKNYLSPSSTTRAYDYFPLEVEQYNPRKYAALLESNQPHLVESLFIHWAQDKNVSHNKQIKDIIHQTIDWMHAHSLYTLTEAVMFLAQSFDLTEEIINDLFVRMCLSQNQLPQLNAFINEWHSKKPQLSLFGQIQSQLRYDVDYCDIILNNPYYLDRILKSNPSRLLGCHQQQELQLKTIETLYLKNHEKYQNDPVQWLEFYNTYIAQSAHKKELSLLFLDYLHKKNIQSAQHFFDLIVSPQKEEYADLWVELFFKKILESYFFLKPGQNQSLQFVSFLEQKIAESGRLPHDFFGHKVNDWDLTSHHNEELYYKIQIKDDLLFIIRLAKLMGLNHIIFNPVALLTIDSSAKYFFNKTHDNIKLSIGNERRLAADTVKQQAAQQNHLQNPQESSAPRPFYIRAIVFLYTVFARIINLWCYTISAIKNFFFRHTHPHLFTRAAPIRLFGLNQPQNREQTAAQQRPSPRVNVVDGHHQSAERAYSLRKI